MWAGYDSDVLKAPMQLPQGQRYDVCCTWAVLAGSTRMDEGWLLFAERESLMASHTGMLNQTS